MVDARIGPGIKSMTKFKKRKEEQLQQQNGTDFTGTGNTLNIRNNHSMSERLGKIFKKTKKKRVFKSPTKTATKSSDDNSEPTSPMSSQSDSLDENRNSDFELNNRSAKAITTLASRLNDDRMDKIQRIQGPRKDRRALLNSTAPFVTAEQWQSVQSCHGVVLQHKNVPVIETPAVTVREYQYSLLACDERMEVDTSTPVDVPVKLPTPTFNKSLPPKKQFRMIDPMVDVIVQAAPIDYSLPSTSKAQPLDLTGTPTSSSSSDNEENSGVASILHKIKLDTSRVTKKCTPRLTPKKKLTDLSMVKNLVKLCTDKNASNKKLLTIVNGVSTAIATPMVANQSNISVNNAGVVTASKYSDNSSDSGYEETSHDTNLLGAGTVQRQSVILSNGVKVHVNPETIVYRTNLIGGTPNAPVSVHLFFF